MMVDFIAKFFPGHDQVDCEHQRDVVESVTFDHRS